MEIKDEYQMFFMRIAVLLSPLIIFSCGGGASDASTPAPPAPPASEPPAEYLLSGLLSYNAEPIEYILVSERGVYFFESFQEGGAEISCQDNSPLLVFSEDRISQQSNLECNDGTSKVITIDFNGTSGVYAFEGNESTEIPFIAEDLQAISPIVQGLSEDTDYYTSGQEVSDFSNQFSSYVRGDSLQVSSVVSSTDFSCRNLLSYEPQSDTDWELVGDSNVRNFTFQYYGMIANFGCDLVPLPDINEVLEVTLWNLESPARIVRFTAGDFSYIGHFTLSN